MKSEGGMLVTNVKQISARVFSKILAEKEIDAFNGPQGRILHVLWNKDGITQRELADEAGFAVTTLTSMIDRMEESGLLKRMPVEGDRRKTQLVLTDKAKDLKTDYDEVSDKMGRIFYKDFSEQEIVQFEGYLTRIIDNLKEWD